MPGDAVLKSGSRIAVIGGGPAGSFFAHFARKWAEQKGLDISVTIFDGKDFLERGPRGCNLCAGVISRSLNQRLKDEGIFLPEQRVISWMDGYRLHVEEETLLLNPPDRPGERIPTVFRGNGPRYSKFPEVISFDDFLLSWAQDMGAEVVRFPVREISPPQTQTGRWVIHYGREGRFNEDEADLVVGAFGVNSFFLRKVEALGRGYRPPRTLTTFQAELKLGREYIAERYQNLIHVYMPGSRTIRFATVIPKGDYITITIIGRKNVSPGVFQEFLRLKEIRDGIPPVQPHCLCYPKIAVSPGKNPASDRLIMIGDASFSRHYKNGLESAFITAKMAAEAAFLHGIDAESLRRHFSTPAAGAIVRDNRYGRMLFRLNSLISSMPLLSRSHLSLAKLVPAPPSARKLRTILWHMFTGEIPYRSIFLRIWDLRLQASLLGQTVHMLIRKLRDLIQETQKRSLS